MNTSAVKIARSTDIKEGRTRAFVLNGKKIVVLRHKNTLYALRNVCPHQGAPLSDGAVHNGQIICLYHGWRFRLADGAFSGNPNLKIPTYPVFEKDGSVYLEIDSE